MKKYIIPLIFVLFLSVSCKKPDLFEGNGYEEGVRAKLLVVSVEENKAHLKVESNQNYLNEMSKCYIINKKTNTQLSCCFYNCATNSFEVDLQNLQPHTTYKVFGIVFSDHKMNRNGLMTNEVTFKTK